jgi:Flp pilus assembly protein TadG
MHGNARISTHENDQIIPYFILTIVLLGLMLAVSLHFRRIVYARGEVSKAADAAALTAACQLDQAAYRETSQIPFLPNTPAMTQDYTTFNAGFLVSHGIGVSVSQIWIVAGSHLDYVTVTADPATLLPGFLSHSGHYRAIGYAQIRIYAGP